MKNTITFLLICIPLFLHAQQGVVATGGDAEGPGGTMSSSTGLTDFYVIESEQFSLQFGLQQTHMDIEVPPDTFAVYVKVVLEGAFSPGEGTVMHTHLHPYIPLSQPYAPDLPYFGNPSPRWYYEGEESVEAIPESVVDWLLLEIRDAPSASQANAGTVVARKAVFLHKYGQITCVHGDLPQFNVTIEHELFVVVYHRNHLAIMSSGPLPVHYNVYEWDFVSEQKKAYVNPERSSYQNGQKDLGGGFFGMYGGDGDGDGQVLLQDLLNVLNPQSGQSGYSAADFDLDGQVLLQDLLNILNPNSGLGTQVP